MTLRRVATERASIEELGLPPVIRRLADEPRGLVLVTGTAGSGKTTTLAAMIDHINNTREGHIVTIEDPIEVLHQDEKCIVNQREIGIDTESYADALRHVVRQDPDVILIGEMRDHETVSAALTAAEIGNLVLSTLHTIDATETINRIIDFFPPYQQKQIRLMLAATLKGIVSLRLIPSIQGGLVPAVEVLVMTGTDPRVHHRPGQDLPASATRWKRASTTACRRSTSRCCACTRTARSRSTTRSRWRTTRTTSRSRCASWASTPPRRPRAASTEAGAQLTPPARGRAGDFVAVAVSAACFSTLAILTKLVYAYGVRPLPLLTWRFAIVSVLMAAYVAIAAPSELKVRAGDLGRFAALALLGYGAASVCFFLALKFASASVVEMLLYTYPAMVVVASAAFLKERLDARRMGAVALSFVGCALVVGVLSGASAVSWPGALLGLGAAVGYTVFTMLSYRWIKDRPRSVLMTYTFGIAAVGIGILSVASGESLSPVGWPWQVWGCSGSSSWCPLSRPLCCSSAG